MCLAKEDRYWYVLRKAKIIERKKERRYELREWAISLKEGRPCADCGGIFHHAAMQWDHLPQSLKVDHVCELVGQGATKERILEEIAKCELVCANCHAIRTYNRRQTDAA